MTTARIVVIGAVIVAIAAGVAILFSLGESADEAGADLSQIPAPIVSGTPLTPYSGEEADLSVGQPAPEVVGSDFDLAPVELVNDGRPKVVLFLAHWCPACQAEVPQVQEWLDAGGKPAGVDFYSVATSIDELAPNYPPDTWLISEGWTPAVVVDTNNSVSRAYGLGRFPYWVFIGADGTVFGRVTGGLPQENLTEIFELLIP